MFFACSFKNIATNEHMHVYIVLLPVSLGVNIFKNKIKKRHSLLDFAIQESWPAFDKPVVHT